MQVLAACGLPWEPSVLRFHEAAGRRAIATASMTQARVVSALAPHLAAVGTGGRRECNCPHTPCSQVRRPLYNTSTGRWRRYSRQLRPLAEQLADLVGSYERALAAALEAGGSGDGERLSPGAAVGGGGDGHTLNPSASGPSEQGAKDEL